MDIGGLFLYPVDYYLCHCATLFATICVMSKINLSCQTFLCCNQNDDINPKVDKVDKRYKLGMNM